MFLGIALTGTLMALVLLGEPEMPAGNSLGTPVVIWAEGEIRHPGAYLLYGERSCVSMRDAMGAFGIAPEELDASWGPDAGLLPVCSGDSVRIARSPMGVTAARIEPMPGGARLTLGGRLDVNHASREELCLVPHMRPEFAEAVVNRRVRKPWVRLEELQEISGVGPKTVEKWRESLSVGTTSRKGNDEDLR